MYKLLKVPFFGRFMVKWQNPLTETQQKEWQKIYTKSKSGGIIHGLFAKAWTENPKATIVLGHPMGKEAKAYFIKNGYTEKKKKIVSILVIKYISFFNLYTTNALKIINCGV